jgi:anti-repressor protein
MNIAKKLRKSANALNQDNRKTGEPWFVAKDACECLALANHNDALSSLDADEKGLVLADTPGGKQAISRISESGLYSLVFRSRKPEAHAFKRWVTHDVLSAIRKHGGFLAPSKLEEALLLGLSVPMTQ